jgi:hypothetical protein
LHPSIFMNSSNSNTLRFGQQALYFVPSWKTG